MISRILNARITWIVAPAISALALWGAGVTAFYPISKADADKFLVKLQCNLDADPMVPWGRIEEKVREPRYFPQGLVGSMSPAHTILALRQLSPEAVETRMLRAGNDVTTGSVFTFRSRHDQPTLVLATKALTAAQQDDTQATVQNLKRMIARQTNTIALPLGGFSDLFEAYRKTLPIAVAAESSATLIAIDNVLASTNKLFKQTRPTVSTSFGYSYKNFIGPERHYSEFSDNIINRSHMLAEQFRSSSYYETSGGSEHDTTTRIEFGIIPWTHRIFSLYDGLTQLKTLSERWKKNLPDSYISGMTQREKLLAATLLLESPGDIAVKRATRWLTATYRELIRAIVQTKLYHLRFNNYPQSIDDLTQVGYYPPPSPDGNNSDAADPSEDARSYGPLEFSLIVPGPQDFESWLNVRYDVKIEESEPVAGGTKTRWKLRLTPDHNQEEAFTMTMDIKAMQTRNDLDVTSWSLYSYEHRGVLNRPVIQTTSTEVHWQPTDYEMLQHWSYLEQRERPGNFYMNRFVETEGADALPPALALTREADGAIIEMETASRFIKISAPQIRHLPANYQISYFQSLLAVYLPEE